MTRGGSLIWANHYDGGFKGNDNGDLVAVEANGDVVICGRAAQASGGPDIYTARYAAATGALIWEHRFNGPGNSGDTPVALALDAGGNVVVAGTTFSTTSNNDFYVAKYAAATGTTIWERLYTGTGSSANEQATAMALDGAGNVFVTGFQSINGTSSDFLTVKFAGTDGTPIWSKVYSPGSSDVAQAIAVDAAGNAIVTGWTGNAAGNDDYATVKFAAANGAVLWDRRYNGPAASTDHPAAIGLDAAGNVFVTGTSRGASASGTANDIYTAKYAAVDGALLWEKRYNGAGNGSDLGNALRVDASGNVVVAGSVNRGSGQVDAYTAKYAAADGALLFEAFVDGAGHGPDTLFSPNSLALKSDGYPVLTAISQFGANGDTDALTVLFSPPGPTVTNLAATGVTATGVTFSASINPNGLAATGTFDYRVAGSGSFTIGVPLNAGAGSTPTVTSQAVAGLAGHTSYEWRAVFTTATGTTSVDGIAFTTLNRNPVAVGDPVELPMSHFNVAANDTDADGDSLTVTSVGAAAHGVATLNADNTVSYAPNSTFAGADSFTYSISDGFGGIATGTVTIADTTSPVIDSAPAAQTIVTTGGPAPMPDLSALTTFHDNSGFAIFSQMPAAGTPLPLGDTSATIKVTDRAGLSASAGVTIYVVAPPTVITGAASAITLTSVTLNGTVNPNKMAATAYFEYGPTSGYGSTTPVQNPGSGTTVLPLTADLAGLPVHAAYHFRIVAANDTGTSTGDDAMFVTGDSNPVPGPDALLIVTQPHTINPLTNDTDPDGDTPLTVSAAANGAKGTVAFTSTSVTYTPVNLGSGTDTFAYTVSDGYGGSAQGAVKVYSVGAEAGFYAGLLDDAQTVNGQAQITLGRTGGLSGRIDLRGLKYSFKGQLGEDGGATIQISRNDQARVMMNLQLLPGEVPVFAVAITDRLGAALATGEAVRSDTSAPGKLRYTMVFPPDPAQAGSDAIPQGTGYAVMTLSRAGKITIAGKLGDGAPFSTASSLRADDSFPFYAGLYDAPRGEIYGTLLRREVPGVSDLDGELVWIKKRQIKARPPQAGGFMTTTASIGSYYVEPPAHLVNRTLVYDAAGDATLTFTAGGLAAPVTGLAHVRPLNPATVLPPLKTLRCTVTDGLLSGSFTPPNSPARTFHGVVLQKQNHGFGYFLTPAQSGTFTLTPTAPPPP